MPCNHSFPSAQFSLFITTIIASQVLLRQTRVCFHHQFCTQFRRFERSFCAHSFMTSQWRHLIIKVLGVQMDQPSINGKKYNTTSKTGSSKQIYFDINVYLQRHLRRCEGESMKADERQLYHFFAFALSPSHLRNFAFALLHLRP